MFNYLIVFIICLVVFLILKKIKQHIEQNISDANFRKQQRAFEQDSYKTTHKTALSGNIYKPVKKPNQSKKYRTKTESQNVLIMEYEISNEIDTNEMFSETEPDIKPDCTINYADSKGIFSGRNISISYLPIKKDIMYIKAYCFVASDTRTFRIDRVLSLLDHKTGEMIDGTENITRWLLNFYSKSNHNGLSVIPLDEPSKFIHFIQKEINIDAISTLKHDCTIKYRIKSGPTDKKITIISIEKLYTKIIINCYCHTDGKIKIYYLSLIHELMPRGKNRIVSEKGIRSWLINFE